MPRKRQFPLPRADFDAAHLAHALAGGAGADAGPPGGSPAAAGVCDCGAAEFPDGSLLPETLRGSQNAEFRTQNNLPARALAD